jgi:hypothetical protein
MSKHIEPQQPPNQKKSDDCADNVADPLARSFWISEIEHIGMVALARYANLPRSLKNKRGHILDRDVPA